MAKKKKLYDSTAPAADSTATKQAPTVSDEDLVARYIKEQSAWREELKSYWDQIEDCQEMYDSYESVDDYSLKMETAKGLVEGTISKLNIVDFTVNIKAKGTNDVDQIGEYVSSLVKDAMIDPDVAAIEGSFRKKKEMVARDYLIKGNAFAEVQYLYKTQIINGKKRVVADNPYIEPIDYHKVIFNPAYYADNSPVYYIEKHASWDYIKNNQYDEATGRGLFRNLAELKKAVTDNGKLTDDIDIQNVSRSKKLNRKNEPIKLVFRWEGAKLCVFAEDKVIIREDWDPFKIGRHNLLTLMNYKITNRPYAYGEIDQIFGQVKAQELVLTQSVKAIDRYLKPALTVDPAIPNLDYDGIMDVVANGGVYPIPPGSIANVPNDLPPQQAFSIIDVIQQAVERGSRYSSYSFGITGQSSDKTGGTASGIQSLQRAAEPNFAQKLDDINDSLMIPMARIYLQMIGNLMSPDEIRYTYLRGKTSGWVTVTKSILTGEASLTDFLQAGLITQQEFNDFVTDEYGYHQDLEKKIIFDVDWAVDVTMKPDFEADQQRQLTAKMNWQGLAKALGVPIKAKDFLIETGIDANIDNPERFIDTQAEAAAAQAGMVPQAAGMPPQQETPQIMPPQPVGA